MNASLCGPFFNYYLGEIHITIYTYLYHYGKGRPLAGIFTSPVAETEQILHRYANNPNHRIGVVNLDIKSCCNDLEKIHSAEKLYIDRIKRILSEDSEQ